MTSPRLAALTHPALTWWQQLINPAPTIAARRALRPVDLRHGQLLRLPAMPGQRLCATGGDLWVTFDGDPAEHVIEAGQTWQVPVDRPLLLQALSDARLSTC